MTIASEKTPPGAGAAPLAGRQPVAAPAAGYVGATIAVLVLGLGVTALRDSAVSAGWLNGRPFLTSTIGWIDGLGFDWWMLPVGILAVATGVWCVYAALRPRRRTAVSVKARSSVWIGPADLARLASRAAESVPGITDARSSATLRTITVTAHTTAASHDSELTAAVTDAVRAAVGIAATPLTIRIRIRGAAR